MFDVGFSELLLLGVVALIVLGPERLPIAMRTLGRFYAKAKRMLTEIQDTIDNELKLAELKQQMQKEIEQIRQTEQRMREELEKLNTEMRMMKNTHASSRTPALETMQSKTQEEMANISSEPVLQTLQGQTHDQAQ